MGREGLRLRSSRPERGAPTWVDNHSKTLKPLSSEAFASSNNCLFLNNAIQNGAHGSIITNACAIDIQCVDIRCQLRRYLVRVCRQDHVDALTIIKALITGNITTQTGSVVVIDVYCAQARWVVGRMCVSGNEMTAIHAGFSASTTRSTHYRERPATKGSEFNGIVSHQLAALLLLFQDA